jgi:hypothetical protein
MYKLGETDRARAIDLMSERLAFARAAVVLYDMVLERLRLRGGPYASVRGHLLVIREEKKAHEEWLEEQVRALGGDVDPTPGSALLLRDEWVSIVEVLTDEVGPARLFQALLMTEVYDNGGWDQLVDLAAQADDEEAGDEFRQRLHEEQEHFLFVGRIVARLARNEILDQVVTTLEEPRATFG